MLGWPTLRNISEIDPAEYKGNGIVKGVEKPIGNNTGQAIVLELQGLPETCMIYSLWVILCMASGL